MYVTRNILSCSCVQLASKDIFKTQRGTGNGLICRLLGHAVVNLYNSTRSTKLDRDILHSMDCMDMKHFVKSYDPVQSAHWEESPLLHYSFLTHTPNHSHTHTFLHHNHVRISNLCQAQKDLKEEDRTVDEPIFEETALLRRIKKVVRAACVYVLKKHQEATKACAYFPASSVFLDCTHAHSRALNKYSIHANVVVLCMCGGNMTVL